MPFSLTVVGLPSGGVSIDLPSCDGEAEKEMMPDHPSQETPVAGKLKNPETWLSWLSVAAIAYMLVAASLFGAFGKSTEMGIAVLAGGLACAFANLQHFESFKGAGFAGQLRKKVDQQAVRIEQLTRLATALGRPLLGLMISEGRWGGGISEKRRDEIHDEVNKELIELGLQENDLNKVNEIWNWYRAFDDVSSAFAHNPNLLAPDVREKMETEEKEILNFDTGRLPTMAEAEAYLDKWFADKEHYEHRKERLASYGDSLKKIQQTSRNGNMSGTLNG